MVEAEIEITEFTNHDSFITGIIQKYGDLLAKLEYYRKKCEMEKGLMETPTEMGPKLKSNLEGIKVLQFSGNIKNYRAWERIFKNTMSRNSQDEGSRLARLIEAIQPPPLKYEIECFTTTKAIWAFLDKLFEDDKELIRILMNEIKTMKPLKVKDTKRIRNFVATVCGFIL